MILPTGSQIAEARRVIYETMSATPQYSWPLLNERVGTRVWLKHENHTPVGAFKIRGALAYFRQLRNVRSVVTATRGNHGQAVAFAARREGIEPIVYVPRGNSPSKNRAMRALGATLVECGDDFEEARQAARRRAEADGLHFMPSFHEALVAGVATYSHELLSAVPDLDVVYVPIGLGSGICGMCAAAEALGRTLEIVGVVSEHAPAYARSFAERRAISCPAETQLADGLACRATDPDALAIIWNRVSRVVTVTDDAVAAAMRAIFEDTHNVAEGAGAAGLAAVLKDKDILHGKRVATVLCGGNVDSDVFARVLS